MLSPLALFAASCGASTSGDSTQAAATAEPTGQNIGTTSTDLNSQDFGTFNEPWAATFAPGTATLFVTQKGGEIHFIDTATRQRGTVTGAPTVDYGGQGGLGDIAFLPAEANAALGTRTIYLSWAEAGDNDTRGAAVGRGQLVCDQPTACRIEGVSVIWRQPKVTGRGHYSHRIAISPDGQYLFVSSGDRQKMEPAQDTSNNLGSVVRLNLDSTPATGNAFSGQSGKAQDIWSFGHRNLLGLQFDAQGQLWDLEHGPAGGDELNLVVKGQNYGWPRVSDGDHYNGTPIPRHSTSTEYVKPAISWNPVIAPGDFIFYSGKLFTDWRGQAIIAAMAPSGLVRVSTTTDGDMATASELQRIPFERRLREIIEGPDGAIWVLEDGEGGRLLKLTPR